VAKPYNYRPIPTIQERELQKKSGTVPVDYNSAGLEAGELSTRKTKFKPKRSVEEGALATKHRLEADTSPHSILTN